MSMRDLRIYRGRINIKNYQSLFNNKQNSPVKQFDQNGGFEKTVENHTSVRKRDKAGSSIMTLSRDASVQDEY